MVRRTAPDRFNEGDGRVIINKNDIVDKFKGGKQKGTGILVLDRPFTAFEPPDGSIGVEAYEKHVAMLFGLHQGKQMPLMEQVEAAVGETDDLSLLMQASGKFPGIIKPNDFCFLMPYDVKSILEGGKFLGYLKRAHLGSP